LYHASVFARDVLQVSAWRETGALPVSGTLVASPDLVADPRGNILYAAYAIPVNEMRGIYMARSLDSGVTWSQPVRIFDGAAAGVESVGQPRLVFDSQSGVLHVIWLRFAGPQSSKLRQLQYAQSADQGATWTAPAQLADGDIDYPQLSLLAPGKIYVGWVQGQPTENQAAYAEAFGSYSLDTAAQWSAPGRIPGLPKTIGPLTLVGDGAGHLYAVGLGEAPTGDLVVIFSAWTGGEWIPPDQLELGQSASPDGAAFAALDMAAGNLVSILRAEIPNRAGAMQFEAIAVERKVAPVTPVVPPTLTPKPNVKATASPTAFPTVTARPTLSPSAKPPANESILSNWLYIGAAIGTLVIGAVGIAIGVSRNRRNR
jgi:hypothetical protein